MDERARILVVDDDELVREVLRDSLEPHFDLDVVSTGGRALEALREAEYAVLVADQRMPQVTGVELATLARRLRPNLVSIILSAYTDPKVMIAAINEGQIFRFVRKPWDNHDLIHTLHQAVERYHLGVANARLVVDLERRLRALETLQEVLGALLTGSESHPIGVLLGRLQEVLPYDAAALLLASAGARQPSLELRSREPIATANATGLRDHALDLFHHFSGRRVDEGLLRVSAGLRIDPSAREQRVESQVAVPMRLGDDVVGVLMLQSFTETAFPEDAARLLDQLANGTAEALVRARSAASEQWQRLEQAMAAIPDGVILANGRGRIQVANASARMLLGDGGPLTGDLWELLRVRPEDAVDRGLPVELRVGTIKRPVELRAITATGVTGEPSGVLAVLRDLSQVAAAEARRHDFVSTFSHEIRTPLSSVSAAIDLLLDGFVGDLSDQQRHYLGLAAKARDGLTRMVDQLLDLERYARGIVEHDPQEIRVAELLRSTVEHYEAAAHERDVTLRMEGLLQADRGEPHRGEVDAELPRLQADPRRLEQLIGNLLSNAIKFANRGSSIVVGAAVDGRLAPFHVLWVRSEGVPIPPSEIDAIFDRFRRGGATVAKHDVGGHGGGSGLGLAICRSIAVAHGGGILAESDADGTIFWVALPSRFTAWTTPGHVDAGPFWVCRDAEAPRSDLAAVVGAVLLARVGLWVRLAPPTREALREARSAVGEGVMLAFGDRRACPSSHAGDREGAGGRSSSAGGPSFSAGGPSFSAGGPSFSAGGPSFSAGGPSFSAGGPSLNDVLRLPGDDALAGVAEAFRILASHRGQEVVIDPGQASEVEVLARTIGLLVTRGEPGWASEHDELGRAVVELAAHVDAGAASLAPVRALVRRTARERGEDGVYGLILLDHLASIRLGYGHALASAVRNHLSRELWRAAESHGVDPGNVVELPAAVVLAGSQGAVEAVLRDTAGRFEAVAELYYRREDRERGHIVLGEQTAPLVGLRTLGLPTSAHVELLAHLIAHATETGREPAWGPQGRDPRHA